MEETNSSWENDSFFDPESIEAIDAAVKTYMEKLQDENYGKIRNAELRALYDERLLRRADEDVEERRRKREEDLKKASEEREKRKEKALMKKRELLDNLGKKV